MSASDLVTELGKDKLTLVFGGDRFGKTALSLRLCLAASDKGFCPLHLDASQLNSFQAGAIEQWLRERIAALYGEQNVSRFFQQPSTQLCAFIDNWHLVPFAKAKQVQVIAKLRERFNSIYLFLDGGDNLRLIDKGSLIEGGETEFSCYDLEELSISQKAKLIELWTSLSPDSPDDPDDLRKFVDSSLEHVNSVIGRNLLPHTPHYILMLLIAISDGTVDTKGFGSYGFHCETLIRLAVHRASEKFSAQSTSANNDVIMGVLTSTALRLFDAKQRHLTPGEFEEVCTAFSAKMRIPVESRALLLACKRGGLLRDTDAGLIEFTHRLGRIYFLARALDGLSRDFSKREQLDERIDYLIHNVKSDDCSQALAVYSYISQDALTIQKIIDSVKKCFDVTPPCDLLSPELCELETINEASRNLEKPKDSVKAQREAGFKQRDALARRYKSNKEDDADDLYGVSEDEIESLAFEGELRRATRLVSLIGQICRNSAGNLDGDTKVEAVTAAGEASLRTLQATLTYIDSMKNAFLDDVKKEIGEEYDSNVKVSELSENAIKARLDGGVLIEHHLRMLVLMLVVSTAFNSARILGSYDLRQVYSEVKITPEPSWDLLKLCISGTSYASFPTAEFTKLGNEMRNADQRGFRFFLLKLVTRRHLMLYDMHPAHRQQLITAFELQGMVPSALTSAKLN